MSPANTVSHATHESRLSGQGIVAPVIISEYPQHRPENEVPVLPHATPRNVASEALLTEEGVEHLRQQNTTQLLKSNYWFEMANIARWCTTGLIGATMLTLFSSAYSAAGVSTLTQFAALGTGAFPFVAVALANPLVLGLAGLLAVAATVTVKASQHSRKVFVEKSFDVQDTLMQRQAKLVGKSVEEAVAPHEQAPTGQRWTQRMQAALDQADSQQVSR